MTDNKRNVRVISTDEEVKIFTDPYRLRIIDTFYESETPLTVKAVADILGEVPAKVHYHVKKLLSIDLIELDHIEIINGIHAKYYKLVTDEFRLELNRSSGDAGYIQDNSQVEHFILNVIDEYKKDVVKLSDYYKKADKSDAVSSEENKKKSGYISTREIYLDEEDYINIEEEIKQIIKKYTKKGENRQAYSALFTFIKKTPQGK